MSENTLASLVPESYFDVIARIIPGSFVLYTYGQPNEFTWGSIVTALLFAYLIGLSLDFIGSATVEILIDLIAPVFKRKKRHEIVTPTTGESAIIGKKMWAECVVFRSIFLFSVFALAVSAFFPSIVPTNHFQAISQSAQYLVLGSVAMFCHIRVYWILSA